MACYSGETLPLPLPLPLSLGRSNGKRQLPAYAADINLLSENINIVRKRTEVRLYKNKEVGLEVKGNWVNVSSPKWSIIVYRRQTGVLKM
jgi:hypothetical protein